MRWLGPIAVISLAACNAADVVVFVSEQAGTSGAAGSGGAAAGAVANGGAGSSGTAGTVLLAGSGGDLTAGGAAGSDSGYSCTTNDDCPGLGWLCSKPTCGSAMGVCKPLPLECDASHAPVCGCNGITFWNDCLREQQGEPSSVPGDCGANAKPCMNSADCGGGDCAKQVPNPDACGQMGGRGVCYVTPPECMVVPESHWWFSCPMPGSPGGQKMPCMTTCQAVQTSQPFVSAPKGACP